MDPQLAELLQAETLRQERTLSLIASENHCSVAVRQACSNVITDKYAEGYPGARYYGGCEVADQIEDLARQRALRLFEGADHANVQPHSGTTANLAVLEALAGPGGVILGMALSAGGHLSHGYPKSHTGVLFRPVHYGVDEGTGMIRIEEVRALALEHRPKVLIAGASSYPRAIDYPAFAAIAQECGAVLLADIAHPAGLIAAGCLASPVPHADVITMTTHKTLRGPRGGLILCRSGLRKAIDSSVFPGGQGGPLMHQIAGKAQAFAEALTDEFSAYGTRVQNNAAILAKALQQHGLDIVTGGTDNHMVLVDLRRAGVSGAEVELRALAAGISVNKNMVPGDQASPRVTSGLRVGTAAVTTRGMGQDEMLVLAEILASLVRDESPTRHRGTVLEMCQRYPLPR